MTKGISWCVIEKKWDVRIGRIFIRRIENYDSAVACRDTCLLVFLADPKQKLPQQILLSLQTVQRKISKAHNVKDHLEWKSVANEIYERYCSSLKVPKAATKKLPRGIYLNNVGGLVIKLQFQNIKYMCCSEKLNPDSAVRLRDALALVIKQAYPTAEKLPALLKPNQDISLTDLQKATQIFARAHNTKKLQKDTGNQINQDALNHLLDIQKATQIFARAHNTEKLQKDTENQINQDALDDLLYIQSEPLQFLPPLNVYYKQTQIIQKETTVAKTDTVELKKPRLTTN